MAQRSWGCEESNDVLPIAVNFTRRQLHGRENHKWWSSLPLSAHWAADRRLLRVVSHRAVCVRRVVQSPWISFAPLAIDCEKEKGGREIDTVDGRAED
jgi:hypothetical protein